MNNILEYNGYSGSIEASVIDNCLHGKILFIADTVTYESETLAGLKDEFTSAVDDYISTCAEIGKEPQRPFKGSFNVRISPDLHKQASVTAIREDISLNELVSKSIQKYVNAPDAPITIEHHNHEHHHHHPAPSAQVKHSAPFGDITGEAEWTFSEKATNQKWS